MTPLQQQISQTSQKIAKTDDPFQKTAMQLANTMTQGALYGAEGVGWGANEIQEAIQNLLTPHPAQQNPSSAQVPLQQATKQISPSPTQTPLQAPSTPTPTMSWYSDPTTTTMVNGQVVTPTPTPMQQATQAINPTTYQQQAAQIFQQQGIPPSVGLGIWAMEGHGKTINPNNPYNIGALDSNPQNANAYQFTSPLDGTKQAALYLKGQSPYQSPSVQKIFQGAYAKLQKTGDAQAFLKAVGPTYSSNADWADTILQTPEYQAFSTKKKN